MQCPACMAERHARHHCRDLRLFSTGPVYRYTVPGMAQVKLSLSHPGLRVEPCRKHTPQELAALAPNMRAKMKCSRKRWPVYVVALAAPQAVNG